MLTFEEFFAKKKIDLAQLQQAEPALFAEFKKDFAPMGEKSFDHSKKFWFNKLRRLYHLKADPKPAKTGIEKTEIASQAEPLESPTLDQSPSFKPRFRAGTTSPATPKPEVNDLGAAERPAEDVKAPAPSGFKPRFNAKAVSNDIKKVEISGPESVPDESDPPVKPKGFKPRFAAQATAAADKNLDDVPDPANTDSTPPTVEAAKPAGFKPRFSMKTVAAKPSETDSEKKAPEPAPVENASPENETKPTPYKPKFNIKNIKPKSEG